jgi:hypothetical protein
LLPRCLQVGQDAYEATSGTLSTYELSGHSDTVVTVRFNASGTLLASAGMDGGWQQQDTRVWPRCLQHCGGTVAALLPSRHAGALLQAHV